MKLIVLWQNKHFCSNFPCLVSVDRLHIIYNLRQLDNFSPAHYWCKHWDWIPQILTNCTISSVTLPNTRKCLGWLRHLGVPSNTSWPWHFWQSIFSNFIPINFLCLHLIQLPNPIRSSNQYHELLSFFVKFSSKERLLFYFVFREIWHSCVWKLTESCWIRSSINLILYYPLYIFLISE